MLNVEKYQYYQMKTEEKGLEANDVKRLSEDLLDVMLLYYVEKKQEDILNEVELGKRFRNLFKRFIKDELSFYIGIFLAILNIFELLVLSNRKQTNFNDEMNALYGKSGVSKILDYLDKHPDSQHKVICERLGMNKSYLSQILKELERVGCINRYATGKRSFFSLSVEGREFVKKKCPSENNISNIWNYKSGWLGEKYNLSSEYVLKKSCNGLNEKIKISDKQSKSDLIKVEVQYIENY